MRSVAAASLVVLMYANAVPQQPATQQDRASQTKQPRIRALLVSGGCCHDYMLQDKILVDAVDKVLPVDWTIVLQGGTTSR